ncbi:MAG: S41 family peptidase [Anaerolineae bacterium]|nr:S41 family peptidase [Anaerolineae bacterium]
MTLILMLAAGFGLGFWARGGANETVTVAAQNSEGQDFPLLDEARSYVDEYFVKEQPDPQAIEYALIRAYLSQLGDPYTFFIEPAVAASESDALAGRYGGIGVEIQRNEQGQFVLYPFAESSAALAGIREGDLILAINGETLVPEASMDEVRQALRGEITEGAGVTLRVRNQAETEEREYFVLFAEVLEPSILWRVLFEAPEIGYVHIMRFTSRTPEEFSQAIEELREAGVQALVLDLRNNSGGLLQESIQIAGEFLDGGVISIERRVTGESQLPDEAGGLLTDLPMAVLVNRQTASASEIIAGALQAYERGPLIGQATFGKGSIQRIFPLADSSSIHVTTALWLTPAGQPLDGVGLTPDISMIPDENGRDVELGEAIRYLQQQLGEG